MFQGQDGLGDLGIKSLAEEREQLAAKLEKRFQDKEAFLRKVNRKRNLRLLAEDDVNTVMLKRLILIRSVINHLWSHSYQKRSTQGFLLILTYVLSSWRWILRLLTKPT